MFWLLIRRLGVLAFHLVKVGVVIGVAGGAGERWIGQRVPLPVGDALKFMRRLG